MTVREIIEKLQQVPEEHKDDFWEPADFIIEYLT
jgi:hypothetical protein